MLSGRRILLGVTGSVAAVKAAELARRLIEAGAELRIALTRGAAAFITPLTFQALTGARPHTDLLDPEAEAAMGHIELARWAEIIVIAPASAHILARMCHGFADDLLTTVVLAAKGQVMVAPAMNQYMWAHPATQANMRCLTGRGVMFVGPVPGAQACGDTGVGRMAEPAVILEAVARLFPARQLRGRRVVITAGPTREPIDPVRFLSNRSSGRMGFALAAAASEAGAQVTLISGPVALPTPPGVVRTDVESAEEMLRITLESAVGADLFIAAAAVADYRPAHAAAQKIKKDAGTLSLELVRNPDILATVSGLERGRPLCVGFAAETERIGEYARAKLRNKGLDLVAANAVGPGLAFDQPDNALEVYWDGGTETLAQQPKEPLARELLALICRLFPERLSSIPEESEQV